MKAFVVVSCLLAVASAALLHPTTYSAKAPVFDHNGYKIDEVKSFDPFVSTPWAAPWLAAKTMMPFATPFMAAKAYETPMVTPMAYSGDYKWVGPQHLPIMKSSGVPLDTPEVAASKVANAVAHVEAKARNGDFHDMVAAPVAPVIAAKTFAAPMAYATHAYPQNMPIIGADGVPLDTPAVALAKAAHFEAHVDAKLRNGVLPMIHYRKRRSVMVAPAAYPMHATTYSAKAPVFDHNGYKIDEVKTFHPFVAPSMATPWIAAKTFAPFTTPLMATKTFETPMTYSPMTYASMAMPMAYSGDYKWVGPQHLPIMKSSGVPLDTPEVAAGKVANAVAHVEAKARNGDLYYHY